METPTYWKSIDDFLESVIPQFTTDQWIDQPTRVIVCFEKDTLSSMLGSLCDKWHVPYTSFHGQGSDSPVYELASWIANTIETTDCERVVCVYLGDYSPGPSPEMSVKFPLLPLR